MRCINCNSQSFKKLFTSKNKNIIKCQKCGLVKTDNFILQDYKNYHRDTDYKKFESHFKNIFKKRFNIANKYIKNGVILDIGTSTGTMLDIFKKAGWETWGVEPSKNAQTAMKKGHKIYQTTFEKANIPNEKFDLIILNHTLEHVESPVKVLDKAYKILKINGYILIDIPNFGSLRSHIYKKNWKYLLPEEHIYHFTPTTLSKLLKKSGFKIKQIESRSGLFEFANPLEEIFESAVTLKKRFFTNFLSLPLDTLSTFTNHGDSFTIIAKKIK